MIRIGTVWLGAEPLDMRAGTEAALARGVHAFGAAHPHHAYLLANRRANRRANRMKVLVHDGIGVWLAARRLNQGQVRVAQGRRNDAVADASPTRRARARAAVAARWRSWCHPPSLRWPCSETELDVQLLIVPMSSVATSGTITLSDRHDAARPARCAATARDGQLADGHRRGQGLRDRVQAGHDRQDHTRDGGAQPEIDGRLLELILATHRRH